jgi:hypothetical protein
MKRLTAQVNTLLKTHPLDSASLDLPGDFDTFELKAGDSVEINWQLSAANNHIRFELKEPIKGRFNWHAFVPHLRATTVNLDVPYFSQRDNKFDPSRTCNVTCMAMVAAYFGIKAKKGQLEDEFYQLMQRSGKNILVHADLDWLLKTYGIGNRFTTQATWGEIRKHLADDNPVVISGRFTRSGHLIVLRGFENSGDFWVNDPFGQWNFETRRTRPYTNTRGENLLYSGEELAIACGEQTGSIDFTWAHFPFMAQSNFDGLKRVIGIERTDRPFRVKVIEICKRLQIDPNWLMACMSFETGGRFSSDIRNAAGSGATGLIQFMPATARGLGTTTQALAQMSEIEQLDWVEKYFQPYKGRIRSLEDCYMAILFPVAIGNGANFVLFRRGTIAYTQNRGLDSNGDGTITAAEATAKVRARFL